MRFISFKTTRNLIRQIQSAGVSMLLFSTLNDVPFFTLNGAVSA